MPNDLPLRSRIERAIALAVMRMPAPLLKRIIRDETHALEGHVLDHQIQLAILLKSWMRKPDAHELEPTVARRESNKLMAVFAPKPRSMARIDETHVPNTNGHPIPIRVYVPKGLPPRKAPMLVYYHGGGFVLGNLDSHDAVCRLLADDARCIVVSVDYRLAPEHKFPAAVEDALAAFDWVAKNAERLSGDASRIAVGGDSAGGNLAAVVSLLARDREGPKPSFQLLIYPATDFRRGTRSHDLFRRGYLLDKETLDYFHNHYLRDDRDILDPRVSPLLATSHAGLPPAFVATAGFDPLRDEGRAYAEKLEAAGVRVTHRGYPTLFHGFFSTSGAIHAARPTLEHAVDALREAFRR